MHLNEIYTKTLSHHKISDELRRCLKRINDCNESRDIREYNKEKLNFIEEVLNIKVHDKTVKIDNKGEILAICKKYYELIVTLNFHNDNEKRTMIKQFTNNILDCYHDLVMDIFPQ